MQCYPVIVGGYIDHLHILCQLSKKIALATLLREVKDHSSAWMKEQDEKLKKFYWQNGYGAFSVNPHQIDVVRSYIQRQHQHHKSKTFQDEFRAFLKKYEVEYDERYVWD
jgi:REP element-mobilizing transposase RayT